MRPLTPAERAAQAQRRADVGVEGASSAPVRRQGPKGRMVEGVHDHPYVHRLSGAGIDNPQTMESRLLVPAGTAAQPGLGVGTEGFGVYKVDASSLGVSLAANVYYVFVTTHFAAVWDGTTDLGTSFARWRDGWFSGKVTVGPGSAAAPSIAVGGSGHGLYHVDASSLGVSLGAAVYYVFVSTHFAPTSSGTRDLGVSFARWRHGWFSGDVSALHHVSSIGAATNNSYNFGGHGTDSAGNSMSNYIAMFANGSMEWETMVNGTQVLAITSRPSNASALRALEFYYGPSASNVMMFSMDEDKVGSNKDFIPWFGSTYKLGRSTQRWTEVWADNAVIQTSDRREKRDVTPVDAVEATGRVRRLAKEAAIHYRMTNGRRVHAGFDAAVVGEITAETSAAFIDPAIEADERVNPNAGDRPPSEPTDEHVRAWLHMHDDEVDLPEDVTDEQVTEARVEHGEAIQAHWDRAEDTRWVKRRDAFDAETQAMRDAPLAMRPTELIADLTAALEHAHARIDALEARLDAA